MPRLFYLCLHKSFIVFYYDDTSSFRPSEGKIAMTKALQQIHPADFSGNLLRGIVWMAEELDSPQFLATLQLDSRAAHHAVVEVYEYLKSLGEYELMFATKLGDRLPVNDAWREMLRFELDITRSVYVVGWEHVIDIRGDELFDRMAYEGAVGTLELWLECAERFIRAYEAYLVQSRSTSE